MNLPTFYLRKFSRCPKHFLWLRPQASHGYLCNVCGWKILDPKETDIHYFKLTDSRYAEPPPKRWRYWEH